MDIPKIEGGWQIILADPAWRFASNSKDKPGRNAMRHYDCMTVDQIAATPVRESAADDALLLMWVTVPFAQHGLTVLEAWGFNYKSQLVWPKQRIGTGYWARGQHELLYIGRRGKFPCLRPALFPTSIIDGKQREHSRKPEWPQDTVDSRFPHMRKIELNARRERSGWAVVGNEVGKFEAIS